jgi:hypothetical protein
MLHVYLKNFEIKMQYKKSITKQLHKHYKLPYAKDLIDKTFMHYELNTIQLQFFVFLRKSALIL